MVVAIRALLRRADVCLHCQGLIQCRRMLSARPVQTTVSSVGGAHQKSLEAASEICRAAIAGVSPRQLVRASVRRVARNESGAHVMCVGGREYLLDQ